MCTVADDGALTLLAVGACTVTVAAAATSNYNAAAASATVTVNPAGALTLVVAAVAGDNTINISEKTAGFTISGATGTEAGVSVAVKLGTETFTAVTSAKVGGATNATWSVPVTADAAYITGASVALSVATAKTGYTAPADFSRTLTVDLTAPTAPGYTAPAALTVGTAITAMSPSGGSGIDAYSATGLPAGLAINPGSGVIAGTPSTANASTASVTVTVADRAGNSATVALTLPAVAKGSQDLSGFGYALTSLNYGAATPTLSAPTLLGCTALSYASATTDVCTVDANGALAILAVGACTVTGARRGHQQLQRGRGHLQRHRQPGRGAQPERGRGGRGQHHQHQPRRRPALRSAAPPAPRPGVTVAVKLGSRQLCCGHLGQGPGRDRHHLVGAGAGQRERT